MYFVAYQRWTLKDAIFVNNNKNNNNILQLLKKCIAEYENSYINSLTNSNCHYILNIPVPEMLCVLGILGGCGCRKLLTGGKPGIAG